MLNIINIVYVNEALEIFADYLPYVGLIVGRSVIVKAIISNCYKSAGILVYNLSLSLGYILRLYLVNFY